MALFVFMASENTQDIGLHYLKLICRTARGIQKKVCEANHISLEPRSAREIKPIPVYEHSERSLLSTADLMCQTEIKWALKTPYNFVPAYFKRYKDPHTHKVRNEIIVRAENYCMARFFAAKELMHCFLDDDGYPATNSVALAQDLIDELVLGGNVFTRSSPQTAVDEIAWYGASQYLIPQEWIPLLTAVKQAILASDPTANADLHLAQMVRVPETVLRHRMKHAATWERFLDK